jgi:hypothetical protein
MKSIVVDKVASVAQHAELGHELRLSADIPCEEGVLVAVRVLNNKARYNQLELTSGRMATVTQGDIVVGALGHRNALRGYSGRLPTELAPGDIIQLLNIGVAFSAIVTRRILTWGRRSIARFSEPCCIFLTSAKESAYRHVPG